MKSIEKYNHEMMRAGFPELYDRVCQGEYKKKDDSVMAVDKMETLSETESLVVQMRDGTIARLNSAYDPENEARIWAEGQKGLSASILFIFGLGNGIFAKEIIKRKGKDTQVLIYEPSWKIFSYTLQNFDISFCFTNSQVRLVVEGVNEDLFAALMEIMVNFENYEDYSFVLCPQMSLLFPESRKRLVKLYAKDGMGWILSWKKTEKARLDVSPYNQLHNFQFLKENWVVPSLHGILPTDVPVILIGAGPSLKDEIETLREAKNWAFLFAADSALPFLMQKDLMPDAYICVEADKPLYFFEDDRTMDIPLFAKMDSSHKLLNKHRGAKIFGWDNGFPEKVYEDYQVPKSTQRYGSNGMTALFSICDELDVETVIFVGQDMCYGEDHHTHVGGRNEGFVQNDLFLYENNQGEMVQSRADWESFIKWYENAIYDCGIKRVINTSLRGVKIQGTDVMTLKEAISLFGKHHEKFEKTLFQSPRVKEIANKMDVSKLYEDCQKEWDGMMAIINKNPYASERKQYRLYDLLWKYEIADPKNDFVKSQKYGMEQIAVFLEKCTQYPN